MIVDGHAHAFPRRGAGAGFASPDEHRRYLQRHMSTHPQGGRRVRDNAPVPGSMLRNPAGDALEDLPDVGFHVGDFGRLEWEVDGEAYYIQFLPPHLEATEARPERMLAQMQYVGVDKALLQSGKLYGITNEFLADVVRRWPARFRGCATIDENEAGQPEQIARLERAVRELGLTALYFSNDGFAASGFRNHFDDRAYEPFWDAVEALGVPVLWDIRFAIRRTHADYMAGANQAALGLGHAERRAELHLPPVARLPAQVLRFHPGCRHGSDPRRQREPPVLRIGGNVMPLASAAGSYRFVPGDGRLPFCHAVIADDGYEIVRAQFERPVPWREGFAAAERH